TMMLTTNNMNLRILILSIYIGILGINLIYGDENVISNKQNEETSISSSKAALKESNTDKKKKAKKKKQKKDYSLRSMALADHHVVSYPLGISSGDLYSHHIHFKVDRDKDGIDAYSIEVEYPGGSNVKIEKGAKILIRTGAGNVYEGYTQKESESTSYLKKHYASAGSLNHFDTLEYRDLTANYFLEYPELMK
ncbi:MAG: hypothetical protein K2H85_08310, partial [Allobaculum sp.]|nr:hypothetical protein [Allobaculum sp.]